jgi:phosphoribosyl-ATP pyrophosphohydrolase
MSRFSLDDLAGLIASRAEASPDLSYTRSLLDGGAPRVAKKLGEEAVECVIAAQGTDREALVGECADLVFHLMVLLHLRGIGFDEILAELGRRTARSGHEEKAARRHAGGCA